jgi:hypothetical protein
VYGQIKRYKLPGFKVKPLQLIYLYPETAGIVCFIFYPGYCTNGKPGLYLPIIFYIPGCRPGNYNNSTPVKNHPCRCHYRPVICRFEPGATVTADAAFVFKLRIVALLVSTG